MKPVPPRIRIRIGFTVRDTTARPLSELDNLGINPRRPATHAWPESFRKSLRSIGISCARHCTPVALWAKSLPIFTRSDEGLHHLSADVVAVELIQLRQPEIISRVIRVRQIIWIAPQVTK